MAYDDAPEAHSEDSYDSEEERYQARLEQQQRSSQLHATAAQQAAKLHSYQQRQQLKHQLDDAASQARIQPNGQPWDATAEGQEASATSRGHPGCSLRALQAHERQWAALETGLSERRWQPAQASSSGHDSDTTGLLGFDDIPWPPANASRYLAGLVQVEVTMCTSTKQADGRGSSTARQQEERAARRAYTKACLRYHPDKFQHRWGRLLQAGDRERVLAEVQAVARSINEAWDQMQQQQQQQQQGYDDG